MAAVPGTTGGVFQVSEGSGGQLSASVGELFRAENVQIAAGFEHARFAIDEIVRRFVQAAVDPFHPDDGYS